MARARVLLVLLFLVAPVSATAFCACDCDADGRVRVSELIRAVGIGLGNADLSSCRAALDDRCLACEVGVASLIGCVRNALDGCPPGATPHTATPTPTPTPPGFLCTPPSCSNGEVLFCPICPTPCAGGCGVACATRTPKCTVPVCREGEFLTTLPCNGCFVCVTPTPPKTQTPSATETHTSTPTPPICAIPTGCVTALVLVQTPGQCAFCASVTPASGTPTPTVK